MAVSRLVSTSAFERPLPILGALALVGYLCAAEPWITGESRETMAFLLVGALLPLFLSVRLPARLLTGVLVVHAALVVLNNAFDWGWDLVGGRWSTPAVLALTVPLAVVSHVPTWSMARVLAPHRVFAWCAAIAAATLLAQPGLWWQFHLGLAYPVAAVMGVVTWRAWRTDAIASSRAADVVWIGVFAFLCTLPFHPLDEMALHHWSFYVGPVEWVQRGRWLLHDVASQYGFLSIAFPAAVGLSTAAASFHAAVAALLFAQAVLVYRLLRIRGALWAGLVVAACVFFFPGGARGDFIGVWNAPSTGAYRFFWALALVFSTYPRFRAVPASLAFAVGMLWSAESAFFSGVIYGVCLLTRPFERRNLYPALAFLGAIAAVETYYRVHLGVGPDWKGFIEFATSYTAGFSALPIVGSGTVNWLVFALGVVACGGRATAVPTAALWATGIYFVSRSHPANAGNLAALWIGILFLVYREARGDRALVLRAVVAPAAFVILVLSFTWDGTGWARVRTLVDKPHSADESFRGILEADPLSKEVLAKIGDAPFASHADVLLSVNVKPVRGAPWLPSYPWLPFGVLLPFDRQREIFHRFYARGIPEGGWLLRPEVSPSLQVVEESLREQYRLAETISVQKGYRLERWERTGSR